MENPVRSYELKTEVRQQGKELGTTEGCIMISFSQRDYEMTESELSLLKSVSFPQTILPFEIKSCVPCTYISTLKLKDSPFLQKL